jgi:hypothetical protein
MYPSQGSDGQMQIASPPKYKSMCRTTAKNGNGSYAIPYRHATCNMLRGRWVGMNAMQDRRGWAWVPLGGCEASFLFLQDT